MELPPRARRIPARALISPRAEGTTSACAENTFLQRIGPLRFRNYLRVRGEYWGSRWRRWQIEELPPRARRIPPLPPTIEFLHGTTSACAENTGNQPQSSRQNRNYLRVRGEYPSTSPPWSGVQELPPRARRIPFSTKYSITVPGTTSACAENTTGVPHLCSGPGNYLRVRGEYAAQTQKILILMELPPRARRILSIRCHLPIQTGTTSACAENTLCLHNRRTSGGNYLRVRGEYDFIGRPRKRWQELPPRARRIP